MNKIMTEWIARSILILTTGCVVGCAQVDDHVYLGIQMDNNLAEHEKNPAKYADTGRKVFINGNFCQFLRRGSSGEPVDKFLSPGLNILEVHGSTAFPVEITICSVKTNHKEIGTILDQKWPSISTGGTYQASFRVNKDILLPIFDKKSSMPNSLRAEQEITLVVSNLYQACITRDKEEFSRLVFEGYKIHSPSEYLYVSSAAGHMFDRFALKPFPERLNFIHGRSLVFVYSDTTEFGTVLFPAATKESASVAGICFAYINNQWIIW